MLALRFNSADEYRQCLRKKSLEGHFIDRFDKDAPYLILIEKYKRGDSKYVYKFRGKRMVIIDSGDKPNYWSPFIDVCTGTPHIYVKDNSYTKTDNENVRIGCYAPSFKAVRCIVKHNIVMREKTRDVFFAGDYHFGRDKKIAVLIKACKKLNLKYEIHGKTLDRRTYLKKMSKAKLCPCFAGKGTRTRREWEALIVGSQPLQENRHGKWPLMPEFDEVGTGGIGALVDWTLATYDACHSFEDREENYDLARACWIDNIPMNYRMAALYLFVECGQLWTYDDVTNLESKCGFD